MPESIAILTLIVAIVAAAAAIIGTTLAWRRGSSDTPPSDQNFPVLMREETVRLESFTQEQGRLQRQELADNVGRFQEAMVSRLDAGIKTIEEKVAAIATKLDHDIRFMGEEATKNRDTLRQTIEAKLEDAALKQSTTGVELRKEVTSTISLLQETMIKAATDQRAAQAEQFDAFARRLSENLAEIDRRSEELKKHLKESLGELGTNNIAHHQAVNATLETKLKDLAELNRTDSSSMREELVASFQQLSGTTTVTLGVMSDLQKERLDAVVFSLNQMSETQEKSQEALRQGVEGRLDVLRADNATKLDEIRKTVDEQLQATLTERITSSFKLVNDHLEQVYRGLGEMQKLADGVGDLKRVLTNVKARGVFGEVQLGSLIEQMFSPDQYLENAQVREGSQERVEFAIKLPGRSGEGDVLIPIDAKFPNEDYERIMHASEIADVAAIEEAALRLEARILASAKDVGAKYINSPATTEFAILFLPFEGLYAEVLRRRGLVESIFEKYRVIIAGPTTLLAMLNAFRMSIRAVAIQKRSTEVWQILGAVRSEFGKHGEVLGRLQRQLEQSLNTVDSLGTRTRAMRRRLQDVDSIAGDKIDEVLAIPAPPDEGDASIAEESPT